MKICFIFGHLGVSDGVARAATEIANLLVSHGHDITLIPLYRIEDVAKGRVDSRIRIKPVFNTYFKGLAKFVRWFFPQWLLEKLVFDDQYDVEVAFQYDVPTLLVGRAKHRKAKHYCWMHTYDDGLFFRKSYMNMDRLYCVSKVNAERLARELGVGHPPVDTCYNLMSDKEICDRGKAPINLKKRKFTFVTVGRLSPEKGYLRLQRCFRRLLDDGYDIDLWIIGGGPQQQELLEERKKLKLEDRVIFTGAQDNPLPYSATGDCFVCSSTSEGYSTACAEAIILGTPVLTTRVAGAEEIIQDAEAGLVVDDNDAALYVGMKYVLDNPNVLLQWRKTIETTKARFGFEERSKKVLSIFSE